MTDANPNPSERFADFGDGFHHLRGTLRVGGVLNVGTHCALVELPSGKFVFLDSYTLPDAVRPQVDQLTDGGSKVAAIINLHPFHTLHIEWMHRAFPNAALYGTRRHIEKFHILPWESELCEDGLPDEVTEGAIEFSTPRGVDLVCEKEDTHFGSVLAYHPASGTIYVDDTLSRLDLPWPLSLMPMNQRLDFHPTLASALKKQPGAAAAFREWAIDLGVEWHEARRIATAHNSTMALGPEVFPEKIGAALARVKPVLDRHRDRYG